MKVLIAYGFTSDMLPSFDRMMAMQPRECLNGVDQLIVTDRPIRYAIQSIVCPAMGGGLNHSLAAARNASIRYAIKHHYDWLVLLDADMMVVGRGDYPWTGYGICRTVFLKENEDWRTADPKRFQGASTFILHRSIFTKSWCRFHEGFKGYGSEDGDFMENVMLFNGQRRVMADWKVAHIWHPVRYPGPHENVAIKRARSEAIWKESGINVDLLPKIAELCHDKRHALPRKENGTWIIQGRFRSKPPLLATALARFARMASVLRCRLSSWIRRISRS